MHAAPERQRRDRRGEHSTGAIAAHVGPGAANAVATRTWPPTTGPVDKTAGMAEVGFGNMRGRGSAGEAGLLCCTQACSGPVSLAILRNLVSNLTSRKGSGGSSGQSVSCAHPGNPCWKDFVLPAVGQHSSQRRAVRDVRLIVASLSQFVACNFGYTDISATPNWLCAAAYHAEAEGYCFRGRG
ncbi:uncharacterized protein LY79DRAFT_580526 [Colletotrichum navitas]|uniref:Uncharacterized protein n=1 Tax=Colletotrichum navitas TaxID=681940 RepID=A0AAD8PYX5_9PEZI|nr:uncharacterized protein LY79DRAFT_580526 [Colletotrichum navitas]KAK1589692.1 hypothetical protein LY79DRAFT_580526 [Colletotrichum navitas]